MRIIGIFLFIITLFACGGNVQESPEEKAEKLKIEHQEAAWDEVMRIHDEVMPKMSDLNRTKRSLKDYYEENKQSMEETIGEQTTKTIIALDIAEEKMMQWMFDIKQLDILRDSIQHPQIMAYMENERKKITTVADKMMHALKAGTQLIDTLDIKDEGVKTKE